MFCLFCYRSCLTFSTMVGTETPSGHPLRMRPGPTEKQQSVSFASGLENTTAAANSSFIFIYFIWFNLCHYCPCHTLLLLTLSVLVSFHFPFVFCCHSNVMLLLVCFVWWRIFIRNCYSFYCPLLIVSVLLFHFLYILFHSSDIPFC